MYYLNLNHVTRGRASRRRPGGVGVGWQNRFRHWSNTYLAANSDSSRPYCNGTFQCRSNNERANSRYRSSDGVGPGVAQLGVSRRGRRFVVCALSVAAWRKEAPDGGDFWYFGLDSRPRAHPAGQHGPCAEVRKAAGLTFSRLHFGGFAPRAWRVSAGRLEKNRGFFGIAPARLVLF